MPSVWIHPYIRSHCLHLDTLLSVARECLVPLGAVVTRAVELGAPTVYLSATRVGGEWILTGAVGLAARHAKNALDAFELRRFREGKFRLTTGALLDLGIADSELRVRGSEVEIFGHRRRPRAQTSPVDAGSRLVRAVDAPRAAVSRVGVAARP